MSTRAETRARAYHALAAGARRVGRAALTDDELLRLVAEHRWALATLAGRDGGGELRSLLNAGALAAHGALYDERPRAGSALGWAIRRASAAVSLSAATFVVSVVLAAGLVRANPVLALALVPRDFLTHIDAHAWGSGAAPAPTSG